MKLVTFALVFLLALVLLPHPLSAQTTAPAPAGAAAPSADSPDATAGAPTTEYTLPPDKLAKAKALYDINGTLRIVGTVWGFVVLLGILYLGIAAKYRDWAEKASRNSFVQAMIAVPLFLLTLSLLDLPLDMYSHKVSLDYGLSVQRWGSWFGDLAKGQGISLVLGTVVLWLMFIIIRKSPRRWWFYFWFPAYAIFFLLTYSAPWIFDPMFNKFEPLQKSDPQLVTSIEKLAQRAGVGIPPQRMFLMKASEKTTQLNAYVTGFGASKRVVIWDTTIQKTSNPETLFIVGHEMGHYVLNHIVYGLVLGGIGIFIALFLIYVISGWMLRRFQERWHIRSLGDWAALPMIFLILSIVGFCSSPIANGISRQLEHDADVYGLEVTHGINANSQEVAAHAFQTLGEISLVYPHPSRLVVFWYYSHPSIPDRVRFAHNYDPWDKGEAPKYVK